MWSGPKQPKPHPSRGPWEKPATRQRSHLRAVRVHNSGGTVDIVICVRVTSHVNSGTWIAVGHKAHKLCSYILSVNSRSAQSPPGDIYFFLDIPVAVLTVKQRRAAMILTLGKPPEFLTPAASGCCHPAVLVAPSGRRSESRTRTEYISRCRSSGPCEASPAKPFGAGQTMDTADRRQGVGGRVVEAHLQCLLPPGWRVCKASHVTRGSSWGGHVQSKAGNPHFSTNIRVSSGLRSCLSVAGTNIRSPRKMPPYRKLRGRLLGAPWGGAVGGGSGCTALRFPKHLDFETIVLGPQLHLSERRDSGVCGGRRRTERLGASRRWLIRITLFHLAQT